MDPLEPNDPLWKVLGKAKPVEPRPNFTQNVLRAARQIPQTRGWWAVVSGWFSDHSTSLPRMALVAAAALVLGAFVTFQFRSEQSPPSVVFTSASVAPAETVAEPPILAVETQLESIEQVGALLALEDTSTLTDREINFLLY